MTPLQERDDGYGLKCTSMSTKAACGRSSVTKVEIDNNIITQQRRNAPVTPGGSEENSYEEMTMSQIMTGKGDYFPGLISLVRAYVDYINCDITTHENLTSYLEFIEKK